jgi:signal transduction histidine kinase
MTNRIPGAIVSLPALIRSERAAVLQQWQDEVRRLPSAQHLDQPTLIDHIPDLLDELASALERRADESISDVVLEGSPPAHGRQRLADGFDIEEVVAEYNILRGCLHDLAERHGVRIEGQAFHIVNRVLDRAIGLAVQTYATQRALEVQRRRDEHLAFVAHDLRTPLQAIALATRMLDGTLPGDVRAGDAARLLRTLSHNVGQLDRLVTDVMKEHDGLPGTDNVRLTPRPIQLWPVVEAVLQDVQPISATAGATAVNAVPEDLIAFADASVLRRIFQNLVGNAIKVTLRGTIVVGAQAIGDDGTIECWVRDDGSGITDVPVGEVFEKGVHAPDSGGSGLGLAIVKQSVEAHGGQVTAETEPGNGSTFRFTLPGRPSTDPRSAS